ncbi:unnamed protein product [Pelagomonas calceolata]|uniref:Sulfotransferase domain-containing protein n=2 Tax=Pelagomonas calceolata TaxID=35677 RepID=A0A8J2X3R4_9STRA|nr:unnamed protein product [Pelagomonas calceolata]
MLRRALVSLVAAAVVGSDAAAAPSSCITNTTNATADERVYALSRKFQCPDVDDVPMACAWTTAWQRRVFHLHMSKMAGREVLARAPAAIDVQKCPGEVPGSLATFRGHVRPPVAPCFYSYETTWDNAVAAYASRPPPLVVTMIREPIAWAFSKITHKKNRRVEPMVAQGCIEAPSPSIECAKINFARFALEHLGSPLGPECDAVAQAALARQRLDASVVGLVEDLDASLCLWEYQFGHHRANATDYARRCDCRGDVRRAAAAASAAALRGNAHVVGITGGPKHAGKYEEQVSLRAVLRIEAALRPHARLYDYAAGLFRRRADVVARTTGVRLLCDDDAPTGYSGAKPA